MIPANLGFESEHGEDRKNRESDYLLDNLQLHQRERSSVVLKADTIGRNLKTVLKKSYRPTE